MDNGIHSGFHTREVLEIVLVQGIRLGNGFVNFGVISPLVLQSCNRIFNCFRHCIYFGLLRNIFTTHNSIDSSFHTGEVLILVLLQGICLGNGFVNFSVISILILQGCNRILDSLCHFIYFRLLSKILVTDNGIHSGFHTREVLVVILLQSICLGNCCINHSVVGRLDALQGKGYAFTFSTVVFVGNGVFVTIHCQRVSTYFPTAPVACLGNVKVSRQGGKVKCAVIANNDLVDINATIQVLHICVADIQRGQLVIVASQTSQCRILADIQRGQLVVVAEQISQCRILADIQRGQLVVTAVQISQRRILTDIQRGQLVVTAVQISQRRILTDIQFSQRISPTVQISQRRILADIQRGQLVIVAV